MPPVVLLIIVLVIVFLVLKLVQDAKARSAAGSDTSRGDRPAPSDASHPSRWPRRASRQDRSDPAAAAPPIDEDALAAHVTKLREAVSKELISYDEAVASVVRHTAGGLSDEAARKLLDADDEAA